ncbi:lipocalin family protein [Flavobacterium capsici]|uniref:Lipocalin family protein n=1 Tax=Flavobacterium capsici TaxID=3075618 RepID=A0AA96J4Z4_9FLAO|nr:MULTISPECIES: lipocalin family protein [unclassified Flavobacterium]WNM17862.1 lipocalin family protein [Flavobacterium sp. PMR2A8]WNM21915.1 lipocalin family protein [Flavobacterium sp. PMTSA4]
MKKLIVVALAVVALFASCSSDDSVKVTEEKLAKKWYYKSDQANGNTYPYEHMSCAKDYIQFLADGSYLEYYITTCTPLNFGTSTGNWVLDGNTVTVSIDGDINSGKITSISDTALQISVVYDYDGDGDEETVKVNFTSN